jgi:hypothetical protein
VVNVDGANRYRMNGQDYKSPSAAGSAVFGTDSKGKPRTCNGWAFWSIESAAPASEGEAPDAATAPTGRTRRRKANVVEEQATPDPDASLPIIERIEGDFECGECGLIFMMHVDAAEHVREAHPAYAAEPELVTA